MKYPILAILSLAVLCAQTAPTPAPPASTQTPPPAGYVEIDPETVIASYNGAQLTYAQLKAVISVLPPQFQQNAMRDRKAFVQYYFVMRSLAEQAEKQKLDQVSPTKDILSFQRTSALSNALMTEQMSRVSVTPEDQQKFYDANKSRWAQYKVKAIYVSFTANPPAQSDPKARKYLTEAEAKTKIEKILAEARKGADFVKLVKENSEDQTSVEKDGDFPPIRHSDNLPEAIRSAIFALKTGEISQPVRQPNGFYLFRMQEVGYQAYGEVRNEIYTEIQQGRFKEWMDGLNKKVGAEMKIENETFFSAVPAPKPQK